MGGSWQGVRGTIRKGPPLGGNSGSPPSPRGKNSLLWGIKKEVGQVAPFPHRQTPRGVRRRERGGRFFRKLRSRRQRVSAEKRGRAIASHLYRTTGCRGGRIEKEKGGEPIQDRKLTLPERPAVGESRALKKEAPKGKEGSGRVPFYLGASGGA